MKVTRNDWYADAVKNYYTSQNPSLHNNWSGNLTNAHLPCGYLSQKHTKMSTFIKKLCKYTIAKWKMNVLKMWPAQSQQSLNQNYTTR